MSSRKMVKKIKHIIIGWVRKWLGLDQDLANIRLAICGQCPSRIHTSLGDACDECGCILDAKTRVGDEKCDMNKW